jgi:crotonobetainyl-CoA:carnitine CoA-transferase CaiB-like acyl-CoA transferase
MTQSAWLEPAVDGSDTTGVPGPLSGLRILDLSLLLPGPFCTLVLADLGADVIKVEPPAGDGARHSPTDIFPVANRNKRSVVLDLKRPEGVAACLALAGGADVFIEGFRPGVMDRLGVGYESVRRVRPGIVYCSISGFGRTGPLSQAPGHDVNFLAMSGALGFSGQWRRTGPQRPGIPFADLSASMYAAVSILAALRRRDRDGVGVHIDLAMSDCAMAFATVRGGESQSFKDESRQHLFPTNGLFACADGRSVALGVVEDHFWRAFVQVCAPFDATLADPRYATEAGRRAHGDELLVRLETLFAAAPADEWIARLSGADVPIHKVHTLAEAVTSDHAQRRQVVVMHEGQRHVLFPALWDGVPVSHVARNAPELGEHTREVLNAIGQQSHEEKR